MTLLNLMPSLMKMKGVFRLSLVIPAQTITPGCFWHQNIMRLFTGMSLMWSLWLLWVACTVKNFSSVHMIVWDESQVRSMRSLLH